MTNPFLRAALASLIGLSCLWPTALNAQFFFEQGYRISPQGDSSTVLIENQGWISNPGEFRFKDSAEGAVHIGNLENSLIWGIPGKVRYEKYHFQNFRVPQKVQNIDTSRQVIFYTDTAFLRVLADGAGRLLYLYQSGRRRYFSQKPGEHPTVLVRRTYDALFADYHEGLATYDRISQKMVYRPFRKQLYLNFRCSFIKKDFVNTLEYRAQDLLKFFTTYNQCMGQGNLQYPVKVPARSRAHHTLKIGVRPAQLHYRHLAYSFRNIDFPDQILYSLGWEYEYFFTAGGNQFSLLLEPTFLYWKPGGRTEPGRYQRNTTVRYHPLEIPGQLRYSLFLEKQSRLYIQGGFIYSFNLGSSFETDDGMDPIEINTGVDAALGLGFRFREKWSLEYRFMTKRNLMNWNKGQYLHFENYHSLYLGYTIR